MSSKQTAGPQAATCNEGVWDAGAFRSRRCTRVAVDGPKCRQHSQSFVEARRKVNEDKWKARNAREAQRFADRRLGEEMRLAGFASAPALLAERDALSAEVKRLNGLIERCRPALPPPAAARADGVFPAEADEFLGGRS